MTVDMIRNLTKAVNAHSDAFTALNANLEMTQRSTKSDLRRLYRFACGGYVVGLVGIVLALTT